MRLRSLPAVLAVACLTAACSASSSQSSAKAPAPGDTSVRPTPGATPPPTRTGGGATGHVFVVNLENKSYDETWGSASPAKFLNGTLVPKGQLLTNYYGIGHASLGNYLAEISGQAPNPTTQADCPQFAEFVSTGMGEFQQALGRGCVYPPTVKTIADQLSAVGKTWKAYQEDIANSATEPKTCRHPAIGSADATLRARPGDMYATRHDPFVYFHSIIDGSDCAARVVELSQLTTDLASPASTPNFSFLTPNLCHDGHDAPCVGGEPGGLVSSDQWLGQWVPKILSSPAFLADGMLVVTFDEAELAGGAADAAGCCNTPPDPNAAKPGLSGPGGGRVGALVISARTKPGSTNPTNYNHYGLLCSVENIFGLDHLGFAGTPGAACFGSDVFNA